MTRASAARRSITPVAAHTTFALLRDARFEIVDFDNPPERALLVLARAC